MNHFVRNSLFILSYLPITNMKQISMVNTENFFKFMK